MALEELIYVKLGDQLRDFAQTRTKAYMQRNARICQTKVFLCRSMNGTYGKLEYCQR